MFCFEVVWKTSETTFFAFELVLKNLVDLFYLVFEVIWKYLWDFFCFGFELVSRNLGDLFCFVFARSNKKKSRGLHVSNFWSNLKESQSPMIRLKFYLLEKSQFPDSPIGSCSSEQ